MQPRYEDIPYLLQQAQLVGLEWQSKLRQLRLNFQCLRRQADGTAIVNSIVELFLTDVSGLAAYYSPSVIEVPASDFVVRKPLSESTLSHWPLPSAEVHFYVNSQHQLFDMETACRTDWFLPLPRNSKSRVVDIHLILEPSKCTVDTSETGIFIRCEAIHAMADGVPLEIAEWRQQFDAWWHAWEQHWADRYDSNDTTASSVIEDTFIPADSDTGLDLTYRPPDAPPVMLDQSDVPTDILRPVIDFHEAYFAQDWMAMARCYPNLDMAMTDRSSELEHQYQGGEFGTWIYVRQVDSWWQEGRRACIVVRGIQHSMPDEETPATNEETVVTYGLRKHGDSWVIWTWSQGWPQYDSAPKDRDQQSWRDGWGLKK